MADDEKSEVLERFAFEEIHVLVRVRVPLCSTFAENKSSLPKNLAARAVTVQRMTVADSRRRKMLLEKRAGISMRQ